MTSREWYKDNFLISTSPKLLQPDAINAASASDLMHWATALLKEDMKKMLDNSLCFGLYALPQSSAELAGQQSPPQIGLARVITDEVTFAYLTDVYVLEDYQHKGLASWLIDCVNEVVESWPGLRRIMLCTSEGPAIEFYKNKLGVDVFEQRKGGMVMLSRVGKNSPLRN